MKLPIAFNSAFITNCCYKPIMQICSCCEKREIGLVAVTTWWIVGADVILLPIIVSCGDITRVEYKHSPENSNKVCWGIQDTVCCEICICRSTLCICTRTHLACKIFCQVRSCAAQYINLYKPFQRMQERAPSTKWVIQTIPLKREINENLGGSLCAPPSDAEFTGDCKVYTSLSIPTCAKPSKC